MPNVMIAEDDLFMADMLEELLVESGYEVCGIARTVEEGVELAELHKPDLAIMDVRLAAGGFGTEIAARLRSPGRPGILYATGNSNNGQFGLTKADGEAVLGKPYRSADVLRALEIVRQIVSTGVASQPFPKGFRVLEPSASDGAQAPANADPATDIKRLLRQQAALASFGSFALGERDLGKILTEAARVCAEGLEVPFSKVCRYRAEENDLIVEAGVGWKQGVVGCAIAQADESSPEGRAFVTGAPVVCGDLRKDATFVLPSFYNDHGIVSTADVVIKRKEGPPYGVLEIDNPVQHDYDQNDINFLTGFANVLAEAVDTAKRNSVMQSALDRMRDMVADRDRLLAAKNLALEEKSRHLDEKNVFAEELQHRVRNNLQLVYAMLSKHLKTAADGAAKEGISAIARRVMTLAQVYDHLLSTGLSRSIDFGAYLSTLCGSFEALEDQQQRNIGLTCRSESVILDLDTVTTLGLVIAELISNSYLHAFPDGKGTISVALKRGEPGDQATMTLADDGAGFSEPEDSKRHGLGLVKRLMRQVGGSAMLRSEQGSTWTLRFPVSPADAPLAAVA